MRVTDYQRHLVVLQQLAAGNSAVARASAQVSSGQRVERLSEDPVSGRQIVAIDRALRAASQYQRNAGAVRHRLDGEETALQQITDLLARAQEVATGQAGSTANAATRAAAAAEVLQLRLQVIALGNTHQGGEFLFGGLATDVPPFQSDGTYVGTPTSRLWESGAGPPAETVHSGQEMLVDSGVLDALAGLETALLANDTAGVTTSLSGLSGAFDNVQSLLAQVGGRQLGIDLTLDMLSARTDSLTARRSQLADIPLEEAALGLSAAQTALQSAYLATANSLSLTLASYLK